MTREVDAREKELTHQVHSELLKQHLEQMKNLTPSFISSIKIHLLVKSSIVDSSTKSINYNQLKNNPIYQSIDQSKDYLIKMLYDEINEIIRILQLTTYDEDEWMSDDLTIMKQKLVRELLY